MGLRPSPRHLFAGLALLCLLVGSASAAQGAEGDGSQVLVDTVAAGTRATDWTIDPRMAPQIGQSFTLDHPIVATRVTLHPDEIEIAKKPSYLTAAYRAEHFVVLHRNASVGATTVLNIWKSNGDAPIPIGLEPKKGFDVAAGGFTNVYSRSYTVPFVVGRPFDLPLDPGLQLGPGNYLVAWFFTFDDKRVWNVRVWGEQNGNEHGIWVGTSYVPSICRYTPTPDTSPPGSSAYVADQWASPYGASPSGPFPGTIGYLTWFHQYVTKTESCRHPLVVGWSKTGVPIDKKGHPVKNPYDKKYQVGNPGDIDMQVYGSLA